MSCLNIICKHKASSHLTSITWGLNPPQTHSFEVLGIMAMDLFEITFILRRPQTHSIRHFQVYLLCTWNPSLLFSGTKCLYVGSALWLGGLSSICFNVVEWTLDKRRSKQCSGFSSYQEKLENETNGAFPLHGTVRFGTVRYGSVRVGCISTAV